MSTKRKKLNELKRHEAGRVSGFGTHDDAMVIKLREIGFAEGDEVEILGRGLLGGTPISVRLNQTVIALRTKEASLVEVDIKA
jgi:ferrous iron transport protein A